MNELRTVRTTWKTTGETPRMRNTTRVMARGEDYGHKSEYSKEYICRVDFRSRTLFFLVRAAAEAKYPPAKNSSL
jgi:hypothetical protein